MIRDGNVCDVPIPVVAQTLSLGGHGKVGIMVPNAGRLNAPDVWSKHFDVAPRLLARIYGPLATPEEDHESSWT